MATNVQKKLGIPEALLSQLNEHTQGGFCLIYVNNHGEPSVVTEFDSLVHQMGIYQFAADFFTSLNKLQAEQTTQVCMGLVHVVSSRDEEPADDEDDEDGDEEPA